MDWLFSVDLLQMVARLALSCAAFALVVAMLGGLRRPGPDPLTRQEPPDLASPGAMTTGRQDGEEARS